MIGIRIDIKLITVKSLSWKILIFLFMFKFYLFELTYGLPLTSKFMALSPAFSQLTPTFSETRLGRRKPGNKG